MTAILVFVAVSALLIVLWLGPPSVRSGLVALLRGLFRLVVAGTVLAAGLAAGAGVLYGAVWVIRKAWGSP